MSYAPRHIRRRALLGLAVCATIAGCSPGADLKPLPEPQSGTYRLGAGDVIRIITFGDQQLSGEFHIDSNGMIAVPLLGYVTAAGLTPSEVQASITQQLAEKQLFHDPSVAVEIVTYRPVFVLGEVSKPGQYPYQPGMTMLTAVAVAGGFTYRALDDYGAVVRVVDGKGTEGRVDRQSLLQPGDVLTIFERHF